MMQCLLMIAALAAGPADPSAAVESRTEVQRLVRRLDSPQLASNTN